MRFAANALGTIGGPGAQEALCDLLEADREECRENGDVRWPICDLVHCIAAMALARLGGDAAPSEQRIIRDLNHSFGQVGIFLAETLKRIGTPSAVQALVKDLGFRRWDSSLRADRSF